MEVLVFITILSLFFVAAMAVSTYSLKAMKTSEFKIIASHYAEEAIEWVRSEKETDWTVFTGLDSTSGPETYCINTLNWSSGGTCLDYELGSPNVFKREVTLTNDPDSTTPDQVNVSVSVYWLDTNGEMSVTIDTVHKLLE